MTEVNTKKNYTDDQVKQMIIDADHVVVLSDFDDTLGYRNGPATIISKEGREIIENFNKNSGNGFLVVTGKSRDQVAEQMSRDHVGPLHVPAVADQFGVKMWPHVPLHAEDYVFVVDTSNEVFPRGRQGIELLNSGAFKEYLNDKGIFYQNIESSDLKSCIFLNDPSKDEDNYVSAARDFISSKYPGQQGEDIIHSLSFQTKGGIFLDVLVEGCIDKRNTSGMIVHALLDIYKGDKIVILNAGDTPSTDGPMMQETLGIAGSYKDRLKVINLGVGDHMEKETYVDILFPGNPQKSVNSLVDYFKQVVNPAVAEQSKTHKPTENTDRRLVDHFRNKQAVAASKQDNTPKETPSRPNHLRLVANNG